MGSYFVINNEGTTVDGNLYKLEKDQKVLYLSEDEILGSIEINDKLKSLLKSANKNVELSCKSCPEKGKYSYYLKVVGNTLFEVEPLVRAAESYLNVDFTS